MGNRGGRRIGGAAGCFAALLALSTAALAGDAERWQAMFIAAPQPPASLVDALAGIAVRRIDDRVIVESSDALLRQRRLDAEALMAPVAAASAERIKAALDAIERDPEMARLAKGLGQALDDAERSMRRGERAEIRSSDPEVARLLRESQQPPDPARLPPIAAYQLELQRAQPNANTFRRQLYDLRRRHARLHAELDRTPAASAADRQERVQRHQQLAQQQLAEATALHAAARQALRPAVEKMALLAAQAEQRGASPVERGQAYRWLKSVNAMLDAVTRSTIEDVGFWAGVQPAGQGRSAYVLALAPDVELRADGALTPMVVPYPAGRAASPAPPP